MQRWRRENCSRRQRREDCGKLWLADKHTKDCHQQCDPCTSLSNASGPPPCPTKPCRWRGKRLHHGGGVCELCVSGVSQQKAFRARLCNPDFFPFRTGLIFQNPPDSANSVRFRGTHVGIKSSRSRIICPKSDGIRPESGGKDK